MLGADSRGQDAAAATARPIYALAFILTASLFFMWAIANNLNDILIRQFEKALQLTRPQASLIQFAFYIGYFVFAIPAGLLLRRIGLKWTMVVGLILFAAGAAGFYPAADFGAYGPFLTALFVIASGVVCLEIAAGAFMVLAGPPETSAFRINLAQAFNGVGSVVAPWIGGVFILSGHEYSQADIARMTPAALAAMKRFELHQVQLPYLAIAGVTLAIALLIALVRYPPERNEAQAGRARYGELLRSPGYFASIIAQFAYVGAQVAAWSFFIDFVKATEPQVTEQFAAKYLLAGCFVLFALGRFSGAVLLRFVNPAGALAAYAVLAVAGIAGAEVLGGPASIGSLMAVSFFMSIMYPTIFDLGVNSAGRQPQLGAAMMVMAIVGGALMPRLLSQADPLVGIRSAYWILVANFAVVGVYAWLQVKRAAAARA
jgi:FHS family L-fucose permease-like MFS transporter